MSAYVYFKKWFSKPQLIKTYEEHIKDSSAIGIDKINKDVFLRDHLKNIDIINKKVSNDGYNFTPYKKKLISKGENKFPRIISIPAQYVFQGLIPAALQTSRAAVKSVIPQ